jgi:hypothetical protein
MPIGLSAKEKLKTIPGQETPARINVGGVTPEQEQMVQNTIGDIAPGARPSSLAFMPHDQYRNMADTITRTGKFLGQNVGRGGASDAEKFGSTGHTHIGPALSAVSMGRTWMDDALLKDPKALRDTLGHELGHYAEKDSSSESGADAIRDQVYRPRAIAQEQLTQQVRDLPLRKFVYAPKF